MSISSGRVGRARSSASQDRNHFSSRLLSPFFALGQHVDRVALAVIDVELDLVVAVGPVAPSSRSSVTSSAETAFASSTMTLATCPLRHQQFQRVQPREQVLVVVALQPRRQTHSPCVSLGAAPGQDSGNIGPKSARHAFSASPFLPCCSSWIAAAAAASAGRSAALAASRAVRVHRVAHRRPEPGRVGPGVVDAVGHRREQALRQLALNLCLKCRRRRFVPCLASRFTLQNGVITKRVQPTRLDPRKEKSYSARLAGLVQVRLVFLSTQLLLDAIDGGDAANNRSSDVARPMLGDQHQRIFARTAGPRWEYFPGLGG